MPRPVLPLLALAILAGSGCGDAVPGPGAREPARDDRLLRAVAQGDTKAADVLVDRLDEDRLDAHRDVAAGALDTALDRVEPRIGSGPAVCGSWAGEADYETRRFAAELLLDVAGRLDADAALQRPLRLRDPYLLAWTLVARDAADLDLPDRVLQRVADDDEARSVVLRNDGLLDELPDRAGTEAAQARADMTQWLAYPSELGCVPRRLRLLQRVERSKGAYYLFAFTPAKPGAGEQVGVSGPWEDGELADESDTVSRFDPAAGRSPAQALERILGR